MVAARGHLRWAWAATVALSAPAYLACDGDKPKAACIECGVGSGGRDSGGNAALGGQDGAAEGPSAAGSTWHELGGEAGQSVATGADGGGGDAPEPACSSAAQCDDGNPCTDDVCEPLGCVHRNAQDGQGCDDGSPCTSTDTCHAGQCRGEAQTSPLTVAASAFGYGTELRSGVELSGGLSAFLSDDRVVFADRLDGSGTLLSVVHHRADALEVEAQGITRTLLLRQPYSGWTWQSHWVTHLLPLGPTRFALAELYHDLRVFELQGSRIAPIAKYEFGGSHAAPMADAVASADGQIFACADGQIARLVVTAKGDIQTRPSVKLPSGSAACLSLAVAADGHTLFASTVQGIARWQASDADDILAELVLPQVTGLTLSADADQLLVHRAGKLDAFGDAELYRQSDWSLQASATQSPTALPFGTSVLAGNALVAWQQQSDGGGTRRQELRFGALTGQSSFCFPLRARVDGQDSWATNYEKLNVRGAQILLQPWRRWLALDAGEQTFHELTGPGHGSRTTLISGDGVHPFALGPYVAEGLDVSTPKQIAFASGGWQSEASTVTDVRLALPGLAPQLGNFQSRSPDVLQPQEHVTATLFAAGAELRNLGQVQLAGGPALLTTRGGSLFQVAASGQSAFRLREYALSPELLQHVQPITPKSDWELTLQGVPERRGTFNVDIDAPSREAVIVELRLAPGNTTFVGPRAVLWLSWASGKVEVLARALLSASDFVPVPALHQGKLLLFDREQVVAYVAHAGELAQQGAQQLEGSVVQAVLGVDGGERAYVAASTKQGEEALLAFDFDAKLRSQVTLPTRALSLLPLGAELFVATKASVHRLTPSCGATTPRATEPWPLIDEEEEPPPSTCKPLATCQTWSASAQAGDVNRDGCVDSTDIALETECYGTVTDVCTASILADLNGNGLVDDYPTVIQHLGQGCTP